MAKEFSEKINSGELKKNAGGRPRAEIDQTAFEKLCALQCTRSEICSWFNVTDKTLARYFCVHPPKGLTACCLSPDRSYVRSI